MLTFIFISLLAKLFGLADGDDIDTLPRRNPRPERFVTVSGRIDPDLRLGLSVVYVTTRGACARISDRSTGVTSARRVQLTYDVPSADGSYRFDVPLDAVRPAECGWTAAHVEYVARRGALVDGIATPPTPLVWLSPPVPLLGELAPVAETASITVTCVQAWADGQPVLHCDRAVDNSAVRRDVRGLRADYRSIDGPLDR